MKQYAEKRAKKVFKRFAATVSSQAILNKV